MEKTTVYLPAELKTALSRAARSTGRSEAELIREGVGLVTGTHRVAEPRLPLFDSGQADLAEHVDELLPGFGEPPLDRSNPSTDSLLMAEKVKIIRRGESTTRVSSKHQVTIPRNAFRDAGLRSGDRLEAASDGPGRVVLTRAESATDRHAGALTGVFPAGALDELRGEWD